MTEAEQDAAIKQLQALMTETRKILNDVHVDCRNLVNRLQAGGFNLPEFDNM